jgi:hypothetical protein
MKLWLDAFPRDWDAALEATVRGRVPEVVYYPGARRDGGSDGTWLRISAPGRDPWTGVFASDNFPGWLNLVASWPEPGTLFVAAGGAPYLVSAADPDDWRRLDSSPHGFQVVEGLAVLREPGFLVAHDASGVAWASDDVGTAEWLGVLDDEIHLRTETELIRVAVRHGRTTREPLSW